MTYTNQKLREALQRYGKHDRDCGVNNIRFNCACNCGLEAALALPTAEQVDDINVAESFTSAAPVGELPELPEPYRALDKHLSHPILRQVLFAPGEYFTADQMRAYARAALSAGDAVDAQRYRLVRRGQHFSVINGIGDTLRGEALDAAADAAMRKGQL